MHELMQERSYTVYLDTLLVFKYTCSQVNVLTNQLFVSALITGMMYFSRLIQMILIVELT